MDNIDPKAVNIAKAIRQHESGGDYAIAGKSGEYGAYQFTEPTWNSYAKQYNIDVPLSKATRLQQNEVAVRKINDWITSGKAKNVGEVASMWNAGEGRPQAYLENNVGTNKYGVKYDTPTYAKKVAENYQRLKAQTQPEAPQIPKETRESRIEEGLPVGTGDRVKPTGAGNLVRGLLKPFAQVGASLKNLGQATLGKEQTDIKSKYFGDIERVGKGFDIGSMDKESREGFKKSIGTGLELASYFPVTKAGSITYKGIKEGFKGGLKQGAKSLAPLAKEGAFGGALYGGGEALAEGESVGTALKRAGGGALAGAVAAPLIGAPLIGAGALGSKAVNKIAPSSGYLTSKIDDYIRNIYKDTTGDIGKIEESAFRAKKGLELLNSESSNIRIPDKDAGLGEGATKPFNIKKSTPNEFISAVTEMDKKIATVARGAVEDAKNQGIKIDTKVIKNFIQDAIDGGLVPKATAKRMLLQIENTGDDIVKIHDWVQSINEKYGRKYQRGTIDDTMTGKLADDVAKMLRKKLDEVVDRTGYAEAYANNQEVKRMLINIAKKANRNVNFGNITEDAGLDAAISVLTGNPAYMTRTIASAVFKGLLSKLRNVNKFKQFKGAVKNIERLKKERNMPYGGVKTQPKPLPTSRQLPSPAIRVGAKGQTNYSPAIVTTAKKGLVGQNPKTGRFMSTFTSESSQPKAIKPPITAQPAKKSSDKTLGKATKTTKKIANTTQNSKGSISKVIPQTEPKKKGALNKRKGSSSLQGMLAGGALLGGASLSQPYKDTYIKKVEAKEATKEKSPDLGKTLMQLESSGGTDKRSADPGELKWLTGLTSVAIKELQRVGLIDKVDVNNKEWVLNASEKYFNLMKKRHPKLTDAEVYADWYWGGWKKMKEPLKVRKRTIDKFNSIIKEE